MFEWLSRLLRWRQTSDVIARGTQVQFIPWQGVYVIARQHQGRTVLTVINGKKAGATMAVKRYAEVIGSHAAGRDVTTGASVDLTKDVKLAPRQTLIIEF